MGYKLASHDTMTYLKPKQWYLYPFRFTAKCQSKSIEKQYEQYGIRYFDLRVSYDKNNQIEFCHGSMRFKGNVEEVLEYLNNKGEEVWIRFILEGNETTFKFKYLFHQEVIPLVKSHLKTLFKKDCKRFEEKYTNLKFHNGRSKWDWKVVYKFKNSEPSLDQKVSSMTWKIFDDWCPWFYAKLMNKKNLAKGTDKDYLMLDFLHIQ